MPDEIKQGQLLEMFVEDVETHAKKVEGTFISAKTYNVVAYRIGGNLIRLDLWVDSRRKASDFEGKLKRGDKKEDERNGKVNKS
jgi:hypothetical protein